MRFTKMHGLGNDFVMVNGFRHADIGDPHALSEAVCDRHFGIGADGLIWLLPSDCADARMRIFNADGSEPEMCGNGIRCAAKFLLDEGIVSGDSMTVETLAGVLTVEARDGLFTVDMGEPCFDAPKIPVDAPTNRVVIDGMSFFCVSMGNPHAVTFDCFPSDERFRALGARLERHDRFPARANIEFCRVRDGGIDVRVWERGDGETLACGTGACAALAAAFSLGLTGRERDVRLPGGVLRVRWDEGGHIFMTGPAQTVFTGDWLL